MATNAPSDLRNINVSDIRENPVALRGVDRENEKYVGLRDAINRQGILNPINVREKADRYRAAKAWFDELLTNEQGSPRDCLANGAIALRRDPDLTGRLAFDETPLPDVVAQLGRWYGTSFRLADTTLVTRTLTASFTTESLADVLATLGPSLDVRFERSGDSIIVRAR